MYFFFFKQKTAYEMRISDWSSDVCSSDLIMLAIAKADAEGTIVLIGDVDTERTTIAVGLDLRRARLGAARLGEVRRGVEPELGAQRLTIAATSGQAVDGGVEDRVLIDSGKRTVDLSRGKLVENLRRLCAVQAPIKPSSDVGDVLSIGDLRDRRKAVAASG